MILGPRIPLAVLLAAAALPGCSRSPEPSPRSSAQAPVDGGGRIAFVQPRVGVPMATRILMIAPDGSELAPLDLGNLSASAPAFSPDGGALAFQVRERPAESDIYTADIARDEPSRVTTDPGEHTTPDWSPNGRKIAYTSTVTGDSEIWAVNADGSDPVQLTHNRSIDVGPDWSPDGRRIVFTSGRDDNFEIYVMRADGSHSVRLTHNSRGVPDQTPAWSPDGRHIAWSSAATGDLEIWVMDADGSDKVQLTHSRGVDSGPSWSPDGRRIAFSSDRSGDVQLWTMSADGSNSAQLTPADSPPSFAPAWSSDPRAISQDMPHPPSP